MRADIITPVSAIVGGGFFGGLLLGYAIKKVVKLIAVIVGLFIAGFAYLQYQQIASFDWNRIEVLTSAALGNVTIESAIIYLLYLQQIFDSIETLDSHKKLEHSELGQPKPPAGVG